MKNIVPIMFLFLVASCKTLVQDEKEIEKIVEDGTEEIIEDIEHA